MQFANVPEPNIQEANVNVAAQLRSFLGRAELLHFHYDWTLPADHLGQQGFLIATESGRADESSILGCFHAENCHPEAAWIRCLAVERSITDVAARNLISAGAERMKSAGTLRLYWLVLEDWSDGFLSDAGFVRTGSVVGFQWQGVEAGMPAADPAIVIRDAVPSDLEAIRDIDGRSFSPQWQLKVENLRQMMARSILLQVALLSGVVVGYLCSLAGSDAGDAHIARLAVDPSSRGKRVGWQLLATAMGELVGMGRGRITLNTQEGNMSSRRLYEKLGFTPFGRTADVWSLELAR